MLTLMRTLLLWFACWLSVGAMAQDFDHGPWDALLQRHVKALPDEGGTRVDYAGMATEQARLDAYLQQLAVVPEAEFASWPAAQRLAFLINAYNAGTVQLVLTRYPELKSIKDLGTWLVTPWRRPWVQLFGRLHTLDEIEHQLIRAPGVYDEPRIHAAVNCASISCPPLRAEAYRGDKLEQQLQQQWEWFLRDRRQNRFDRDRQRLMLSKLFDWYEDDFVGAAQAQRNLAEFAAAHAELLADDQAARTALASGSVRIGFSPYDWSLNDLPR